MASDQETIDALRISDLFSHIMSRSLSHRLIGELSSSQVSFAQVQALRYVWLHENVMMGDLANGMDISYPSATNMVKRLERRGLVQRRTNPADHREVEVLLTEAGLEMVERMEAERAARVGATLSAMDPVDREAMVRGLRAFVTTAVSTGKALPGDICLRCGLQKWDNCPVCRVQQGHKNG